MKGSEADTLCCCRLRQLAPTIVEHGVDYEIDNFNAKLAQGMPLDRTRACIRSAIEQALRDSDRPSLIEVHALAMLSIVTQTQKVDAAGVPETLQLDVNRLTVMQTHFNAVVNHFTLFALASSLLCRHGVSEEVKRQVFGRLTKSITADVINEVYNFDTVGTETLQTFAALKLFDTQAMDVFAREVESIKTREGHIRALM